MSTLKGRHGSPLLSGAGVEQLFSLERIALVCVPDFSLNYFAFPYGTHLDGEMETPSFRPNEK